MALDERQPRYRARRRVIARCAAGAAAFIVLASAASGAQAVQRSDVQTLDGLYKRSLDLTVALTSSESGGVSQLNATGDPQTLDCLETLREATNQVSDQLMDVDDVAGLAAGLHRAKDRRLGSRATGKAITRALGILPVEARQINQTAGLCLTQNLVQDKARDALQLISDATSQLTELKTRLQAPAKPH